MRKLAVFKVIIATILLIVGNTSACFAGSKTKDIQKECKKICKQLKSEGWYVYGKTTSLDNALLNYYKELESVKSEAQTLIGRSEAKNINMAISKAKHNLKVQYASLLESKISGEVNINMTNEVYDSIAKSNIKFDSTYESSVNKKIQTFKPNLILTRTKENGNIEIQMYLIVE